VSRIDIHPTTKEPDRHIVRVAPVVSRTIIIGEAPTKLNLGPYYQDEVLAPSDARPGRHPGLSHSHSNKPPRCREVWFDKVVTMLLGLPCPIKTWHTISTNQNLPSEQKWPVLDRHRWRLPHRNLRIFTTLSPPFPSECSTNLPTCPAR
jgi:hypothetical protein